MARYGRRPLSEMRSLVVDDDIICYWSTGELKNSEGQKRKKKLEG